MFNNVFLGLNHGLHCCVCCGVCTHTSPPTYCAQHNHGVSTYTHNGIQTYPNVGNTSTPKQGWECPKCTQVWAPFVDRCNCKK